MAVALPPGIGTDQQALQATAFIREQPWYLQWIASLGKRPDENGNVSLNDDQQSQLRDMVEAHGIGLNHKYDGIDKNGQIVEEHHKLRNGLIAAGIGAAALSGLGAAGIGPMSGLFGATTGAVAPAATAAGSGGGILGGVTGAIGAGSKIAGLLKGGLDIGGDTVNSLGNADAQRAQAETNNRYLGAKIDQSGPAADTQAFRNAMRAGLVARMDPNAAPGNLNGHALPSLANADTVDYAKTMFGNLRDRQAAGKTPTEFGVPEPSAQELADTSKAGTYANVGTALNTGSKIANLLNLFRTKTDTSGGDTGGIPIPGGEFDPSVIYG